EGPLCNEADFDRGELHCSCLRKLWHLGGGAVACPPRGVGGRDVGWERARRARLAEQLRRTRPSPARRGRPPPPDTLQRTRLASGHPGTTRVGAWAVAGRGRH